MPAIQNACLASLSAALLALLPACGEAPQKIDRLGGFYHKGSLPE